MIDETELVVLADAPTVVYETPWDDPELQRWIEAGST